MKRISLTPFGSQPVTAGVLATQALAQQDAPVAEVDKWSILQELCVARCRYEVTDRDLAVLSALVSFLPGTVLQDGAALVVFPSNKTLSQRAHGMAESTLRRHLAALVKAGLILRHDSPNGKRYARRTFDGGLRVAYGFDLRPLLVQAEEICTAAHSVREAEEAYKAVRERCVITARDAAKLIAYGQEAHAGAANWDALEDALRLAQRGLRRKLSHCDMVTLEGQISEVLSRVVTALDVKETQKMSGNDDVIERHHHNSKTDTLESEPCLEKQSEEGQGDDPQIPLSLVVRACPDLELFGGEEIKDWPDIVRSAHIVRPMIGISQHAWDEACNAMGPCNAAVSVGFILQRMSEIKSPGGYLRALARKAGQGAFSTGPMIMSLLNRTDKQAA